jgi:hypothetical protein
LLDLSATGPELTEYHVEAAIASIHARAVRTEDTDWKTIVSLYDTLTKIRPSPVSTEPSRFHSSTVQSMDSKRSAGLPTVIASLPIRFISRRWANWRYVLEETRLRANIFARRSLLHAIRWSADFSVSVLPRVNRGRQSRQLETIEEGHESQSLFALVVAAISFSLNSVAADPQSPNDVRPSCDLGPTNDSGPQLRLLPS